MSYIGDLNSLGIRKTNANEKNSTVGSNMNMDDFLQIMVAQFQNQDPENAADTSEMLNQIMMMSVIQAIENITDASVMQYSSSLVGKEVTVAYYDANDELVEKVGTVTGSGTYGGQQVVFLGDDMYYLTDIMAVGRLPEKKVEETETDKKDDNKTDGVNGDGDGGDGDDTKTDGTEGATGGGDGGNDSGGDGGDAGNNGEEP